MGVALFVDDDPAVLASFQRAFSQRGYAVHVASTASAALRLFERVQPDAATVDLRIGAEWGLDLIRDFKQRDPRVRLVLVSGYLSVAVTAEAMRAGAEHVFFKPVTTSELASAIEGRRITGRIVDDPPPSLARAMYEHVSRVLVDAKGNVSETARRLGVHRHTVQRCLRKIPRD